MNIVSVQIALVEDNDHLRTGIARQLRKRLAVADVNAIIHTYADPRLYMENVRQGEKFDLTITDWDMPGGSGYDIINAYTGRVIVFSARPANIIWEMINDQNSPNVHDRISVITKPNFEQMLEQLIAWCSPP